MQDLNKNAPQPVAVGGVDLSVVDQILSGIDVQETDGNDGWWETSEGARFGAGVLKKLKDYLGSILASRPPVPAPVSVPVVEEIQGIISQLEIDNYSFDISHEHQVMVAQAIHANLLTRQPSSHPDMANAVEALDQALLAIGRDHIATACDKVKEALAALMDGGVR